MCEGGGGGYGGVRVYKGYRCVKVGGGGVWWCEGVQGVYVGV